MGLHNNDDLEMILTQIIMITIAISVVEMIIGNHDDDQLLSIATPMAAHCGQHIMSLTRLVDAKIEGGQFLRKSEFDY